MAQQKEIKPEESKYQLIDGLNRMITLTKNTRDRVQKLDPKDPKYAMKVTSLMLGYSENCKKVFG